MADQFGVAIVGAGIGAHHLAGFKALGECFDVRWLCDLDTGRAQQVLDAAGAATTKVTNALDEVLSDDSVDIVDICLPPHLHAPAAIQAFEAGKHVICEKPLAGNVLEADAMVAAAAKAKRLLVPIFQYRYGKGLFQTLGLIERGLTGKPFVATLETHWNRGADYYAVDWRGKWASERGGAVLGHAIHAHDLLSLVLGDVAAVSAMLDTRVNPIEVEDCAAINMRFTSGALATSSITLGNADDRSRLRFVFENIAIESGRNPYAPGDAQWSFQARSPLTQMALADALAEIDAKIASRPQGYAGEFMALHQTLTAGQAVGVALVDAASGVRSIELVAAIYKSAREGSAVVLPIDRADPMCADWVPEAFRSKGHG
ncbi:MAG: Gfo/Idh/MocA family oxidoreductase [Pseudomonadota bacterium]